MLDILECGASGSGAADVEVKIGDFVHLYLIRTAGFGPGGVNVAGSDEDNDDGSGKEKNDAYKG